MNASLDVLKIPPPIEDYNPRWLTEDYKGKEEDILQDLYRSFYWVEAMKLKPKRKLKTEDMTRQQYLNAVLEQCEPEEQQMILSRLASSAAMASAARADELKDDFSRAYFMALWTVNKRKLWNNSSNEYETFEEFLVDRVPRLKEEGSASELSDTLFMMSDVLPMLETIGGDFTPDQIVQFKEHWSKTRAAVPYLRMATSRFKDATKEIDEYIAATKDEVYKAQGVMDSTPPSDPRHKKAKEKQEQSTKRLGKLGDQRDKVAEKAQEKYRKSIVNTIEVIADPTIRPFGPTGVGKTLFSKDEGSKMLAFQGGMAIFPEQTLFFFSVPPGLQRAIISSLRGIVDFDTLDSEVAFDQLDKTLHPKSKGRSHG